VAFNSCATRWLPCGAAACGMLALEKILNIFTKLRCAYSYHAQRPAGEPDHRKPVLQKAWKFLLRFLLFLDRAVDSLATAVGIHPDVLFGLRGIC